MGADFGVFHYLKNESLKAPEMAVASTYWQEGTNLCRDTQNAAW